MTELAEVGIVEVAGKKVIVVSGEVDFSNATFVSEQIRSNLLETQINVIDLTRATYLDSSAINMIFGLHRELASAGNGLKLVAEPSSNIHRVLEVSGLADALGIADSVASALGARGSNS